MLSRPPSACLRTSAIALVLLGSGCASSRATFEPSPFPPAATVAPAPPVIHVVQKGETLAVIAKGYGVTVDNLRKSNKLKKRAHLSVGQKLVVPVAAKVQEAPPPVAVTPDGSTADATQEFASPPPDIAGFWLWPIEGNVSSKFGIRHHRGHAGIDVTAPNGTPVFATRDGTVSYAARQGRYGQLVVVEHEQGMTSWYAHLSVIQVKPGQKVKQGDRLGLSGSTGNATGPHLHFEVRREGKALDPLQLLP